jgi:hypothetical protein
MKFVLYRRSSLRNSLVSIAVLPLLSHYSPTTLPLLSHYSPTTLPLLSHYSPTTLPLLSLHFLFVLQRVKRVNFT